MAIIIKIRKKRDVGKAVEKKGILMHCWWRCNLEQPLRKTVWRFLKKLRIKLPYDLAIPVLGIHPKNKEILIQKYICIPMFTAALLTIAKMWKQPKATGE